MRWLATRWRATSGAQKAIAAVVLLLVVGAGAAFAGLGRAPTESPSAPPSAPPDTTAPTLAEVNPVPSDEPATLALTYTFTSDEAGTIAYLGACTSDFTAAEAGNNTITFSFLRPGQYSGCTLQVTDAAGNASAPLTITAFTVNPRPPSIARIWNEALLSAIRIDRARPPVQARNLFHTSAAMYDIWAAYEGTAFIVSSATERSSLDCANEGSEVTPLRVCRKKRSSVGTSARDEASSRPRIRHSST